MCTKANDQRKNGHQDKWSPKKWIPEGKSFKQLRPNKMPGK